MKKTLSLVSAAIVSLALQVQMASPQTASSSMSAATTPTATAGQTQSAGVNGELSKRLDTKNAKVGDPVEVRVTNKAKLADGTEIPRGAKLIGKVTEEQAESKQQKNAHLAFTLDHAVLKDGHEIPVRAVLTSASGPVSNSANDMMMPSGGGSAQGGGAAGTSTAAGGGASAAPAAGPMISGGSQQPAQSAMLKSAQDHVPVGNMPGVMLSGAGNTNAAGSFDAADQNIDLESGTKLTLNVSSGQE